MSGAESSANGADDHSEHRERLKKARTLMRTDITKNYAGVSEDDRERNAALLARALEYVSDWDQYLELDQTPRDVQLTVEYGQTLAEAARQLCGFLQRPLPRVLQTPAERAAADAQNSETGHAQSRSSSNNNNSGGTADGSIPDLRNLRDNLPSPNLTRRSQRAPVEPDRRNRRHSEKSVESRYRSASQSDQRTDKRQHRPSKKLDHRSRRRRSSSSESDTRRKKSVRHRSGFWTIIGFVLFKSPLRTFNSKSGGKGYLFTFDVRDVSGEIRVTSFNAETQKFFEIIELHQFYSISFATVIKTKPEFKQLKNDFEIRSTP